jgi:hypothetical protein
MSEGRSAYARAADDWHVEPPWVSERLLDARCFHGGTPRRVAQVTRIRGAMVALRRQAPRPWNTRRERENAKR